MNISQAAAKRAEIIQQVQQTTVFWESREQGRLAYWSGWSLDSNPHIPGHMNAYDWARGWKMEQAEDLGSKP